MVQTRNVQIEVQLAAIAARLDAILTPLKADVDEIKARMYVPLKNDVEGIKNRIILPIVSESPTANHTAVAEMSAFPDFMSATATKTKEKGQMFSLGEFVTLSTNTPSNQSYEAAKGLTVEDTLIHPPRAYEIVGDGGIGVADGIADGIDGIGGVDGIGGANGIGGADGVHRIVDGITDGFDRTDDEIDDSGAMKISPFSGRFGRREKGGNRGCSEGPFFHAADYDSGASNETFKPLVVVQLLGKGKRIGYKSSDESIVFWDYKQEVPHGCKVESYLSSGPGGIDPNRTTDLFRRALIDGDPDVNRFKATSRAISFLADLRASRFSGPEVLIRTS